MISAEKAREITAAAQAEENARVRSIIEIEAEEACEVIRKAAVARESSCEIGTRGFQYPNGVTKYLSEELGYKTEYNTRIGCISVSW